MTAFETLGSNGISYPVDDAGMVCAAFRTSDDAATFDFHIPSNMMLSRYHEAKEAIVDKLENAPEGLMAQMRDMATGIRPGIEQFGVVTAPNGDHIFVYEVDGFGGQNLIDDANIPSLLPAPSLGYLDKNDTVYQNTRRFVLLRSNPWCCQGLVIHIVGNPHIKPGVAWPIAAIMRSMSLDDDDKIINSI
ncbi:hypothetical protein RRF57_001010 [Xylaria bambusicola]|uniref:Uncharacterized protein n=1 Tax=Xylaria bambusicola TaxID=326684 RepID=A0AAN7UPR9_9PEZI